MKPLVIYHAGCLDGFCCAWLFHLAFPDADFHAAYYGTDPPDVTGRSHVYVADFSYKRPVMLDIHCACLGKLTVLDHHKTAEEDLKDFDIEAHSLTGVMPTVVFDMAKSGGRLTWDYLKEEGLFRRMPAFERVNHMNNGKSSWLVDYTEDRDLWRWTLPESRAVNAALRSHPFDFGVWDKLEAHHHMDLHMLVAEGNAILRAERQLVEQHVKHAREVDVLGYRVPCVNATALVSEIGNELCRGKPFSLTYFDRGDGFRVYSLRSSEDGVDVSEIAKRFGGGGHRNAAGFQVLVKNDHASLKG